MLETSATGWLKADKIKISQQVGLAALANTVGLKLSQGQRYSAKESTFMKNGSSLDFVVSVERKGYPIRLVIVEMDGPQHTSDRKQVARDKRKDSILGKMNGVWLVRATKPSQLEEALTLIGAELWA